MWWLLPFAAGAIVGAATTVVMMALFAEEPAEDPSDEDWEEPEPNDEFDESEFGQQPISLEDLRKLNPASPSTPLPPRGRPKLVVVK